MPPGSLARFAVIAYGLVSEGRENSQLAAGLGSAGP